MKKSLILFIVSCVVAASGIRVSGQLSVGATLFQGGMKAYSEGRYSEAERLFRMVIAEVEQAAKEGNPLAPGLMSDTLSALTGALQGQGKLIEAEQMLLKQIELLEKEKIDSDSDFSQTSAALNNLGLLYTEQKKFKAAEETLRRAIRLREKYDVEPKRNLAVSLLNLGKVFYDKGRYLEAEPFFRQAQNIYLAIGPDGVTEDDVPAMAMAVNNLGLIAARRGNYNEAEARFIAVIGIIEDIKGRDHPDLVQYLKNYASLLRNTKRLAAARKIEARIKSIKVRK